MEKVMKLNLHTHTHRCHHARGDEREYVENAIKTGIEILGFADHTPQPYPNNYVSKMRMSMAELEDYVTTVHDLKREYAGQIEILLGFEVEYYPLCFEGLCNALAPVDYDYFILAQHHTKNEFDGKYAGVVCTPEMVSDYVDGICLGLDLDCFTYVAHPDLPKFYGDPGIYREQMTRLCKKAKEKNVPLEINLLGLAENRFYPRDEFWRIAAEIGNTAIWGIDAHCPEDFFCQETYNKALELARGWGVEVVDRITLKSPKGERVLENIL